MTKTILVDAWKAFVTEDGVNVEMQTMLDQFDAKKIIVTNANEEEMKEYGIVGMPYEVFTLAHNPNKTDPEYFKKLLESYSLEPEEVLYFEHDREAVASAESVGISSYWYDDERKDLNVVEVWLKENV